jgi:hypothetical protein
MPHIAFEYDLRDDCGIESNAIRGFFNDDCTGLYIEFPGTKFTANGYAPIFITYSDGVPTVHIWDNTALPHGKVFYGPRNTTYPSEAVRDKFREQFKSLIAGRIYTAQLSAAFQSNFCFRLRYVYNHIDTIKGDYSIVIENIRPKETTIDNMRDHALALIIDMFWCNASKEEIETVIQATEPYGDFINAIIAMHNAGKELEQQFPRFDYKEYLQELWDASLRLNRRTNG